MGSQAPEKPDFIKGKRLLAAQLKQLMDLITTFITGGDGIKITKYGDRIVIQLEASGIGGLSGRKAFRIKSVEVDHLVCRTWDGKTEGSVDVKVALAPLLRRTPFEGGLIRDGFTYVYTSNTERVSTKIDDSTTEDQLIIPKYVVNDVIIAARTIAGSTGVFQAASESSASDDIDPIEWVDMNLDGRSFSEKLE